MPALAPEMMKTAAAKRRKKPQPSPDAGELSDLLWFAGVATAVMLLLAPSYRSTDFEVHRNWLAVTSSLPLSQWYLDETSPWTLDYPPLFAYFERLLAVLARLLDPTITDLRRGLGYAADSAVLFQRLSVVASDVVLFYAVHRLGRRLGVAERRLLCLLVIWSPALVMVDHVHFQYNGFLIGVLMVSVSFLLEGRDLAAGFVFAVVLCLKHLFAVAAPVYFVYLLGHYCKGGGFWRGVGRFLAMGAAVGAVFAVAFGPFLYYGQIQQVLQRMFPFGRGLCHAYWAPNFWVFYILIDKACAFALKNLGYHLPTPTASFTGGLVGDSSPFYVLPQVTPVVTFLLVLLAISPALIKAWRNPQPKHVVTWIAYAFTCGFLFGWHVHEKASLHFVIPLAVTAICSLEDARHYFLLSIVSCYSMFPLLFRPEEYLIKVLLLVLHAILIWVGFTMQFKNRPKASNGKEVAKETKLHQGNRNGGLIGGLEFVYIIGMFGVEVWGQYLHSYFMGDKLPFIPLMLISVYCSMGMSYSWLWQLRRLLRST